MEPPESPHQAAIPNRTYTPVYRQPWQDPIRFITKAIDEHTHLYLSTNNRWHYQQAEILRRYLSDLKAWLSRTN